MEPRIENEADLRKALSEVSFVNTNLDFKWEFDFLPIMSPADGKVGWKVWASFERPDTESGEMGRGRFLSCA